MTLKGDKKLLEDQLKAAHSIIIETLWMARRYADGRMTFAPTTVNECIDAAIKLGIDIQPDNDDMYATDGTLGKWDPKRGKFEKE